MQETEELEREIEEDGLVLEGSERVTKRKGEAEDMGKGRKGEGKVRKRVKKDVVMGVEYIKLTVE